MNIAVNAQGGQALEVVSPIDGKVYARRSYASGAEPVSERLLHDTHVVCADLLDVGS